MDKIKNTGKEAISFESFKHTKETTFWWASDLLKMLGYKDMKSFQKVLDKTTKAFNALNIPYHGDIIPEHKQNDRHNTPDFKLSRFACYLSVMNGDPKKIEVAEAQVYFARQVRKFELYVKNSDQTERLKIRDDLTEGNKILASIAKQSGVENYADFQNAGYIGMYNMSAWELIKKRGVKKGTLLDHMGRTELAANLFRVTQTEERIINQKINGQSGLEQTHNQVGKEIREMIQKNVASNPENLPVEAALTDVKTKLKSAKKKSIKT